MVCEDEDASGRVLTDAEKTAKKRKDGKHEAMLAAFVEGAKARGLSVKEMFEELDTDGSGQLTSNELHAAFERLGIKFDIKQVCDAPDSISTIKYQVSNIK